jgi:phosphonate transport system substrate-binding protein
MHASTGGKSMSARVPAGSSKTPGLAGSAYAGLLLLAALVGSPVDAVAEVEGKPLTFGIVPQQAAAKLARLWAPLLDAVSEESGVELQFRTAPDIPEFEQRVANGDYDIAYMNPYHYTVFHNIPGYRALARQAGKRIRGIIVVSASSPIVNLAALSGTTVAFPAPLAFAATVLPQAELRARNIAISPRYVSSHDSVYRAVAKGLFPAGGGIQRTLGNIDEVTRSKLRVLWTTAGFTSHAIATHPRISERQRESILRGLLSLSASEQGRALLAAIRFKGLEPADDADWNDVRALKLAPLKEQ